MSSAFLGKFQLWVGWPSFNCQRENASISLRLRRWPRHFSLARFLVSGSHLNCCTERSLPPWLNLHTAFPSGSSGPPFPKGVQTGCTLNGNDGKEEKHSLFLFKAKHICFSLPKYAVYLESPETQFLLYIVPSRHACSYLQVCSVGGLWDYSFHFPRSCLIQMQTRFLVVW